LEKQKLTPEECVLRLTTYLESVEKAALTAKNEVEFETVWDVRKSVIGKRNAAVESVKHEIGTDLNKAAQEIRQLAGKADHLAAIKQLSDVGGELLPKIQVIKVVFSSGQAGTDALPKAVTEGVTAAVKEVLVVAEKQVAELEQNRDAEVKADSSGDTPEPGGAADGPSAKKDAPLEERPGRYEALGHRLSELRQAMDDADVPTWLGVLSNSGKETKEHQEKSSKPATSQVTECEKMSANLQKRIESLSGDLSRLQGLRYNLWALRTIYRAESSPNWDGILGRIDVGLLQPTVGSRYSSTYETLIKDKTDPRTRIVAVQNVLNGKKIGLTSF
jgi:enamine deaminase RidA (YjgF/YER057c/UK114 family)